MEKLRNLGQTRRLIRQGLLVLLVGLLCGFGLAFSISGAVALSPIPLSWDYTMEAPPRAWRAAHVGAISNGLMAVLIAVILPFVDLAAGTTRKITTGTIVVIWGNAIFYVASLWAPNRGLSLGDTMAGPGNLAGVIAYVPAVVAAVLLIGIVGFLIHALPRAREL